MQARRCPKGCRERWVQVERSGPLYYAVLLCERGQVVVGPLTIDAVTARAITRRRHRTAPR